MKNNIILTCLAIMTTAAMSGSCVIYELGNPSRMDKRALNEYSESVRQITSDNAVSTLKNMLKLEEFLALPPEVQMSNEYKDIRLKVGSIEGNKIEYMEGILVVESNDNPDNILKISSKGSVWKYYYGTTYKEGQSLKDMNCIEITCEENGSKWICKKTEEYSFLSMGCRYKCEISKTADGYLKADTQSVLDNERNDCMLQSEGRGIVYDNKDQISAGSFRLEIIHKDYDKIVDWIDVEFIKDNTDNTYQKITDCSR